MNDDDQIARLEKLLSAQQARADQQAEWAMREAETSVQLLEALEIARTGLQAMLDAWLDYHDAHSLTEPVTGKAGNAFDKALEARDNADTAIAKARGQ